MSLRPLLSAGSEADEAVRLKREIAGLEAELQEAKDEAQTAKQASADAIHAIRALRKQLEPLYTSLRMIFGEISRVDAETAGARSEDRADSGIWPSRIQKVGAAEGRILQALLDGGEMSFSQIRSAAKTHGSTHHFLASLMNRNWVQKTGRGSYSLK